MHWLEADPICREPRSTWQELGPSMSIQYSETNFRCFQCVPPSFRFGYFPSHWFFAKKLWKAHLVDGVLKASTPIGRIGNSIDLQPVPQAKGRYSTGANGYMACTTCLNAKTLTFNSHQTQWNATQRKNVLTCLSMARISFKTLLQIVWRCVTCLAKNALPWLEAFKMTVDIRWWMWIKAHLFHQGACHLRRLRHK